MKISEKEFAIIKEISNNHLPDQRSLANKTGISLGLTNLIIKRLIKKGYIKAKQLNQKKIQYFLTPKGFSEKAKKSYNYAVRTINLLKLIKENVQELIIAKYKSGYDCFEIYGNNELADIVEIALINLTSFDIKYSRNKNNNKDTNGVTISFRSSKSENTVSVDLISYLAETGLFYN